jgi:hypothetical protein
MSFGPHRRSLLGLLFPLAACSSAPSIPTSGNGELHQGTFVYTCSSSADAACGTTDLPSGIAVGADFDLRFTPTSPATTSLEPSASFFSVAPTGRLHTTRAGYGVVLATSSSGAVVDFVNLRVKSIASLTITGLDPGTGLHVGETRSLGASAFDAAGERLAGTLSLEWESANDDVAAVTVTDTDRSAGTATLHAAAAGTARLRVVAGASTGTLSVEVTGS